MAQGPVLRSIVLSGTAFGDVEIRRRQDGKNVRIVNGRRGRPVGRFASTKTGIAQVWESRSELYDIYHSEVDTRVTSYTSQPETLSWYSGAMLQTYTPDRAESLIDGSRRVIEVKSVYGERNDIRYSEKLAEVSSIYTSMGCQFVLRQKSEIMAEPVFSAVETIQAYRRSLVTAEDVMVADQILAHSVITLGEFIERLPSSNPLPTALAMMVRRVINIDLSSGLNIYSLVANCEEVRCAD